MRTISAAEAEAKLLDLLREVERGELIVITRNGKAIARIEPIQANGLEEREAAMRRVNEITKTLPSFSRAEVMEMVREGRR